MGSFKAEKQGTFPIPFHDPSVCFISRGLAVMNLAKLELRKLAKEKRSEFPPAEIKRNSRKISARLFHLPAFKKSEVIACFVSLSGEVETRDIIERALTLKKHVAVPVTALGFKKVFFSAIRTWNDVDSHGKGGIPEPSRRNWRKVKLKDVDLVIAPGLLFDREGNRLGYGAGVYDRLLKQMPHAVKIGVAFNVSLIDVLPRDRHDVPVDMVVTEKEIIRPGRI